jgi:hypothetical protein
MEEQAKRGWAGRPVAIAAGVLALLAVVPAAGLVFLSIFLFDAPGSVSNGLVWAIAWGFWMAPVACLTSAVLAFVAAARRSWRWLGAAIALPILLACYIIAMWLALASVCGGRFAC